MDCLYCIAAAGDAFAQLSQVMDTLQQKLEKLKTGFIRSMARKDHVQ